MQFVARSKGNHPGCPSWTSPIPKSTISDSLDCPNSLKNCHGRDDPFEELHLDKDMPPKGMFAVVSYIFNEPLGIAVPRKRYRIGTLAAIRSILPVCANRRFSEDFENPGSHRYEDKRVSAARFPALRDFSEDHVVPMTKGSLADGLVQQPFHG